MLCSYFTQPSHQLLLCATMINTFGIYYIKNTNPVCLVTPHMYTTQAKSKLLTTYRHTHTDTHTDTHTQTHTHTHRHTHTTQFVYTKAKPWEVMPTQWLYQVLWVGTGKSSWERTSSPQEAVHVSQVRVSAPEVPLTYYAQDMDTQTHAHIHTPSSHVKDKSILTKIRYGRKIIYICCLSTYAVCSCLLA